MGSLGDEIQDDVAECRWSGEGKGEVGDLGLQGRRGRCQPCWSPKRSMGKVQGGNGINKLHGFREELTCKGETKHLDDAQRRGSRSLKTLEVMSLRNI